MNNNIEKYDFKKIVEKHVNNTNLKIKTLEGSNSKLFGAVKKAIDAFNGDKKSLKLYRQKLESNHRSTISMMIRVAKNDLIRQHETKLPTSYQTLNELIKLINELKKIDGNSFELLLEKEKIHPKISKSEVVNLRTEIKKQNTVITHKTAGYEKATIVKNSEYNLVKTPNLKKLEDKELEDFVSNLDETRRKRLIELLTETRNENKEAA